MAWTTAGLPNNGQTGHFQVLYDTTLSNADGVTRALALMQVCEQDFALMASWFAGVKLVFNYPLRVQIGNDNRGGRWTDPSGWTVNFGTSPAITVGPGSGTSVNVIRYLLVSEMVEMFMVSKNNNWSEPTTLFQGGDEGSMGEGLSRFLGVQFQLANGLGGVPPSGFKVVPNWLNSAKRQDFVNNDPDDIKPDATTGCTTLFIYYLHDQLGHSIQSIINAGAKSLAGVYKNLTGQPDGWTPFINLVNSHYPTGFGAYNPAGDNIFPMSNLSQFIATNAITCGYGAVTQIVIDRPALAQVNIRLASDDTSLVRVPAFVTIPVGGATATVNITTTAIAIPFATKTVNVHASYGGATLTIAVQLVPPLVTGLTLNPPTVTCGDSSTGTITLSEPSLLGPVVVDMICGAPGYATVPAQVTIPQGAGSVDFPIPTPDYQVAFKTAVVAIYANYAGSSASATLLVQSRIVSAIINTFSVSPSPISVGGVSHGTITLVGPVAFASVISLEALDVGTGVTGPLPGPGNPSTFATVPSSITIPAGMVSGTFLITTHGTVAPHTQHLVRIAAGGVPLKFAPLVLTA
jgi:hypothetical protein